MKWLLYQFCTRGDGGPSVSNDLVSEKLSALLGFQPVSDQFQKSSFPSWLPQLVPGSRFPFCLPQPPAVGASPVLPRWHFPGCTPSPVRPSPNLHFPSLRGRQMPAFSFPAPTSVQPWLLPSQTSLISSSFSPTALLNTPGRGVWGTFLNDPSHNTTTSSKYPPDYCHLAHFWIQSLYSRLQTSLLRPVDLAPMTILYRHCSVFVNGLSLPSLGCWPF